MRLAARSLRLPTGFARGLSRRALAQPAPESHPHLMAAGEVTPGISAAEYAQRRQAVADLLPDRSVAIFSAAPLSYMCHDVPYPYRPDVDLLYLTGFHEPTSLLACVKPAPSAAPRWHFFVRPTDPAKALWDGPHAGVQGAQRCFLPEGEAHDIAQATAAAPTPAYRRHQLRHQLQCHHHQRCVHHRHPHRHVRRHRLLLRRARSCSERCRATWKRSTTGTAGWRPSASTR